MQMVLAKVMTTMATRLLAAKTSSSEMVAGGFP
jgi:hypothetical protein